MAGEVTLPEITVQGAAPAAAGPAADPHLYNPFAGGDFVAVKNRDGSFGAVPRSDLPGALETGSRPATEAEYVNARVGVTGAVAAGAIGAARGATFGLSDPIMIEGARAFAGDKGAEDARRTLNLARAANPTASLSGELVGSLAGMGVLPGAAGGAARGASIVEHGLALAPRAAIDGAVIGIGHQASEDALGNHDASAEKYVASTFKGAALGGVLGFGLGAAGGAVGNKLRSFYGRATEGAEVATARAGAAEGGILRRLGDFAANEAESQAFKSTGAKLRDFQKLGATAEAQAEKARRIGRKLIEEEIVTPLATQEKIAERLLEKTSAVGRELGAMRATLDTAEARPFMSNIVKAFEERVLTPRLELPLGEVEAAKASEFIADMLAKGGETPSFGTLYKYRRELDRLLERGGEYARVPGGPAKVGAESLRDLRGIIEEEFTIAGERAANELGGTFSGKYKVTKELYADLITARHIATKEAARGNANQAISLTDVIATVGGVAADGASGILMGAANHMRRKFGNQIATHVLDKVARLQGVQRASAGVDAAMKDGVAAFLSGKAARGVVAQPKVTAETARGVREAVRNPEAVVQRVQSTLGESGLSGAAPKTAQAVATTLMRAAVYLRDKTPKEPAPPGLTFGPAPLRPMSESKLASFAATYEAVTDPISIVDDLQHGRLDREKVAALKVVYPQLYAQLRKEVIEQGTALEADLTEQQKIALSILFEAPISAMMDRKVIASFQRTFAQGADPSQAGQAGGQPAQPGRGLGRTPNLASGFDKQEAPT